jgi:hypothetical protein
MGNVFTKGQKVIFDIPGRGAKNQTGVFIRATTDGRGVDRYEIVGVVALTNGETVEKSYLAFPKNVSAA